MTCWYVYMLRCSDGSLYTGITNNWKRRLSEHQNGKGAKYTRGRRPVRIVWLETVADRSKALRLEWHLKSRSSGWKESMVKRWWSARSATK